MLIEGAGGQAVQDDTKVLLQPFVSSGMGEPAFKTVAEDGYASMYRKPFSIFAKDGFNITIFDELHAGRRPGRLSHGMRMLRSLSLATIGLTATPMMTTPVVCSSSIERSCDITELALRRI